MSQPTASELIEAERRRLARLVDDHLIRSLVLLQSQAGVYEQTLNAGPQAQMAISLLAGLIRQTLQKARDLQDHLHPTILETLGLEPALESLANQVNRASGINIVLKTPRLAGRLPYTLELQLFRAVQSLLDHATDHHANRARVQLELASDALILHYEDNSTDVDRHLITSLTRDLRQNDCKVESRLAGTEGLMMRVQCVMASEINLTPRELDVLQLVAVGMSNKEVAAKLHVTPRTVNFHLDNIYTRLGVNTRTEAVVAAIKHGWVNPPD